MPRPGEKRLAVRISPAAQRALRQGHPWIFDHAVQSVSSDGRPGDLAVVFDDYRRFMAAGLYDPYSPVRVRVLQHGSPATIDRAWFRNRLQAAAGVRKSLPGSGTDGYRLVHGENDGLPGLVIDRYAATLVIKLYTLAWLPWLARCWTACSRSNHVKPSYCVSAGKWHRIRRACSDSAMEASSMATLQQTG